MRRIHRTWKAAALALSLAVLTVGGDALAIVGRPLTPMSYAGVARRTTRRSVYYGGYHGAYYGGAAVAGAAVAGAATAAALTALPPGCMVGVPCAGGVVYRPVYQGTTLVYVPG